MRKCRLYESRERDQVAAQAGFPGLGALHVARRHVGHQQVQAAEFTGRPLHEAREGGRVGDVDRFREHRGSLAAQFGGGLGQPFLAPGAQGQRAALGREGSGDRPADAPARAGHQRLRACQFQIHRCHSFVIAGTVPVAR
jgi:hypothetical protein